jgi:hypothetical protein
LSIARTLDEQSNASAQMARREAQARSKIREAITHNFHGVCGFRTDYQYITKSKMRTIQKKVKEGNKLLYFVTTAKIAAPQ